MACRTRRPFDHVASRIALSRGKQFRRVCLLAGVRGLRIHDLRHFATIMLFVEGVADAIISKLTGHRPEELER